MSEPVSTNSTDAEREIEALRAQLAEAQELIRAIQSGDVDAVVVSGPQGEQVFTLRGADYAYRALVEAMNEGAATLSADGTVLYCNQRLSDLLGRPLEQIIGAPAIQLVTEQGKRTFETLLAHALRDDGDKAELELEGRDGGLVPVYLSIRHMKAEEPTALCMVVTDLTEHKKRDELIAAGKLATSILESAAEAIAVCDATGKIIGANEQLENLCACTPLFQQFDNALPLTTRDSHSGQTERFSVLTALSGVIDRQLEVSFSRNDGQTFALLLSSGFIEGPEGVVGCVLTLTDITERKRAEQALIQSEKLASVGRIASTIAHEINNPLETIGQVVYLAMTEPGVTTQAKSYLEIAAQELDRVAQITRQTLAFHRESQAPTLIDLREIADGALNLFAGRLKSRNIRVETRYETADQIWATGGEVRQILSNLLSNSMDALPHGGQIKVRISPSRLNGGVPGVRLTIADTGSGIRPEQLKRIFEPFFTTKEMVGTGLGLWVTKQIAEKHHARIRVRSKPDEGTVFSIVFPVSQMSAEVSYSNAAKL